jgi:hypothetical protein
LRKEKENKEERGGEKKQRENNEGEGKRATFSHSSNLTRP